MGKATKLRLWIAAFLVILGAILFAGTMAKLGWDFSKLSTVTYETHTYQIQEDFDSLSIRSDWVDISLLPSQDGSCKVVCYEEANANHSVSVEDGTLTIRLEDKRSWQQRMAINFTAPKVTVYLPQEEYADLSVKVSTGDIHVEDLSAHAVTLKASTGQITATAISCRGAFSVGVSTGAVKLTDITCRDLTSTGDTGSISLKNVIATESLSITRSTGNVSFDGCDAARITVKTDTGNVTGSLLTDKTFLAESDTGRVNVPRGSTGGKCEITTDTGNIKITVEK